MSFHVKYSVSVRTKAIYTCIVGGYDNLAQPEVIDDSFDYILLVPKGQKSVDRLGVWTIREYDYIGADNTITSRYPKMNSHLVLPEYEYTLWMDGNLIIVDQHFYDSVNLCIDSGSDYAGIKHPLRDCVYDDAVACMHAMRDSFNHIIHAVNFLINQKFPRHYGLMENNVILRRNDDKVNEFNELWWNLYLNYPRRDQFVAPYCFCQLKLIPSLILPDGENAKTIPWLRYVEHRNVAKSRMKFWYDYFACRVRTYLLIAYLKIRLR